MRTPTLPALLCGDNIEELRHFPSEWVNLTYLDPPFFTGKRHSLFDRTLHNSDDAELSFDDIWKSQQEYLNWMRDLLVEIRRILKSTGTIFLHCDWHASHLLRVLLDEIFHPAQFRAEIIWSYKRWTNTARVFQKAHQTIFFYSKTEDYTFNTLYEDYSFTTNIDQIWQQRTRDKTGRSVTATNDDGSYIPLGRAKPGIPMRDVWEIPYLNPRSHERTGWPTQKPVELLRRIILSCTNVGDLVMDPVCGSGTTLVAAKALGRMWIGIDSSPEAVEISKRRLAADDNRSSKALHHAPYELSKFLQLPPVAKIEQLAQRLEMHVVRRNRNLDGLLKLTVDGAPVAAKYLDGDESNSAIREFLAAAEQRGCKVALLVIGILKPGEKKRLEEEFRGAAKLKVVSYSDVCRKTFDALEVLRGRQAQLDLGRDSKA